MNHVFARIKRLRNNPFRKVLSNCTLYDEHLAPTAGYPVYSPDHKLDEDSWFKFENFSASKHCIDILKQPFDAIDIQEITRNQFLDMAYILAIQGRDFHFQKIMPALFLYRKNVIHFGEAASLEKFDDRLVIGSIPDAIYKKETDTLIFKNLSTIASIFPGIDELYKEATHGQVVEFLANNFINLAGEYSAERVSKPNRKRVALAMETLDGMLPADKAAIISYIEDYCQGKLIYDKQAQRFSISSDEELKNLFFGIEQRFYTTPVGSLRRLANSVQDL